MGGLGRQQPWGALLTLRQQRGQEAHARRLGEGSVPLAAHHGSGQADTAQGHSAGGGTWENPEHRPPRLWTLPVTRALARFARLGLKAAWCLVLFSYEGSQQPNWHNGEGCGSSLRAVVKLRAALSNSHWSHVALSTWNVFSPNGDCAGGVKSTLGFKTEHEKEC